MKYDYPSSHPFDSAVSVWWIPPNIRIGSFKQYLFYNVQTLLDPFGYTYVIVIGRFI